ncbi:MAG TPA: sulfurtransferase [Candidatus Agrococcus pullicola]|uniref:Sulfurtransferase n=1 Tax=Candidatus Agrococcus pullicola TaxID=2838429 RepID=A0A9D1YS18_9MICO|nr:sulfurtransferase [Candidatus Agrococcus pullicola]
MTQANEDASRAKAAASSETSARTRRPWVTPVAFVAVAALAATAGVLVSNSLGGASTETASPNDEGTGQAALLDVDYGEARGPVHQEEALVSTDWLDENIDDPNLVIIEVSEGREGSGLTSYEAGHVPGAVEFVWYRDFVERLNRDLIDREAFTSLAQNAGVNADSTVVIYGDANNWFAAYGAWVFKLYGFEDVRLLDGGREAWEQEGRELSPAAPSPAQGDWEASAPNSDIRAFQGEVLEVVNGQRDGVLVDIRGPQEFNGEIGVAEGFGGEAAAKWGHIPGAVYAPWGQIVNQPDEGGDGTLLDVEEIRDHYAELGVDGSVTVYVYCRIGERASHTWYVLSQVLGYDVKLYDGSWTEWGNSVGVPIENPTLADNDDFSGLWGGN